MAWHSDNESIFQGMNRNITIVSLSIGTSSLFEVRRKASKPDRTITQVTLDAGDIVVMEGWFQKSWQHRLLRQIDLYQARVNLTWGWAVAGGEEEGIIKEPHRALHALKTNIYGGDKAEESKPEQVAEAMKAEDRDTMEELEEALGGAEDIDLSIENETDQA